MMVSFSKVLIDGDSIAYAAGYASSYYRMKHYVDKKIWNILRDCGVDDYELWLEDWGGRKEIFRNRIAEQKSYKGNRKSSKKPMYLDEAREYMKTTYNANITKDFESEDMCIIRAHEIGPDEVVIAYIDKDVLQYPLYYYNYEHRYMLKLSEPQAQYNLWKQVLTGDSVDNIPGIPGIGPKRAEKILEDSTDISLTAIKAYKNNGCPYYYFLEQYNLIKLRSKRFMDIIRPITEEEYDNL